MNSEAGGQFQWVEEKNATENSLTRAGTCQDQCGGGWGSGLWGLHGDLICLTVKPPSNGDVAVCGYKRSRCEQEPKNAIKTVEDS